jgi:hypothetical protein
VHFSEHPTANKERLTPNERGKLEPLLQETHELISILYRSIETAKKNAKQR